MTEETLFAAALEKATKAERDSFLENACAGDSGLRRRIEALLESHDDTEFLKTSAAERAAIAFGGVVPTEPASETELESPIDFLEPSERPGSLGRLGHYEVLEVIGRGGMGVVLRAFDEKLHRVVAIKVMAAQLAACATARRRFAREAQAAAAVSHDHIVTIHAVEEAGGLPYLVMQFVAGMSLQERLESRGSLHLHEILRIGLQAAAGLAAAHAQGLIHRDIKPANILLENGVERVKLTDFGLARAVDDASMTQSGVVAGTPQYMAPEQARGEPVDRRADLFSLGSVLYAMCTGRAPFRASGTMAVLKRVCEEMPSPIREANPEIPGWLVAIIEKLHAKDPAERYQSAAEVADVLGRHLAHVQHPSVVPLPPTEKPSRSSQPGRHRSRAAVAAVLLCLAAGLGFAEATGVTRLATTVIRVLTPDGTLVIEANDPGVKVTVEGDGDLVITRTGAQEVRLRPGSYKVRATKDGKPVRLDRELVSITQHDKQVVRVRLEGEAVRAAAYADRGAFVVMGGSGFADRKFDTLLAAVLGASDGDTIEIRGNGPFVVDPIKLTRQALTLRAADGFRPVIRLNESARADETLLRTDARLVLEGLELQRPGDGPDRVQAAGPFLVWAEGDALYATNCRFRSSSTSTHRNDLLAVFARRNWVQNCEFLSPAGLAVTARFGRSRSVILENNLLIGKVLLDWWVAEVPKANEDQIRLSRNTLVTDDAQAIYIGVPRLSLNATGDSGFGLISFKSSGNLFDTGWVLYMGHHGWALGNPKDDVTLLKRLFRWSDQENLYQVKTKFLAMSDDNTVNRDLGPKTLSEWKVFWGQPDAMIHEGPVHYRGGNLTSRLQAAPEHLAPADFRLRPDSAGYRVGPNGNDLGADIDLVGPGPAYERWKRTPDYHQWLKETGQLRGETSKPKPNAFVVIGGKGVSERKLDTLAEAVAFSSKGDTIEIRGNGPYVVDPITISGHSLTIRAGDGYRPVIRLSPKGVRAHEPVLRDTAPLVLEGLEIQRLIEEPETDKESWPGLVTSAGSPLYVANCLFRSNCMPPGRVDLITADSSVCHVRNCALLCPAEVSVGVNFPPCRSLTIENCVHLGHFVLSCGFGAGPREVPVGVRLMRNTVVSTETPAVYAGGAVEFFRTLEKGPQARLEATGNIFDARWVLQFNQGEMHLMPRESERLLRRLLVWRDQGNLTHPRDGLMFWSAGDNSLPYSGPKNAAEWKTFWDEPDASLMEGVVRYEGGNLASRLLTEPENIGPVDFRLRPDSAGYRAGPDGKDLGAEIDLVGPGPAYERWKKTPDYQQWLKDTGQALRAAPVTLESDAAQRELAKWQGEWKHPDQGRLIIEGNRWAWHPNKEGPEVVSTIKIVEVTDKMTHVLLLNTGLDGKVRTIQVILRVDGDTLHNCGTIGAIRPTEFAQKHGYLYYQWKRVTKPPP